jgi:hypothetical protein
MKKPMRRLAVPIFAICAVAVFGVSIAAAGV